MPCYWLMKSEPGSYSILDLERDGTTSWEGVRNYQARNFMRDVMQPGDGVLYLPQQRVDIAFEERFPEIVPLAVLRETPGLEKMLVINKSRLSVQPVTPEEWKIVRELANRLPFRTPSGTV
jgi:predicted RNA-binding protein with PUA-like domain